MLKKNTISGKVMGSAMRLKNLRTIILLSNILLLVFLTPGCLAGNSLAGNSEGTPNFQAQYNILNHELYVSIQPSLYNYYGNLSHGVYSDDDYARLVTPQVVESIAENIRKIIGNGTHSDEQFANAVLTLVHQIPYIVTDVKYPVETLEDNFGDCVGLSLLAASIMKAGGLDVVLIHYTGINPGHMNVGVYLPYKPIYHNLLMTPTGFEYNNNTYWTAEATPQANWKIGDQSDSVAGAMATIIPLDNTEQASIRNVSSSTDNSLPPSSVTLNLSQQSRGDQENTRSLIISGAIQPALANQTVTINIGYGSSSNNINTFTDNTGNYNYVWNFTAEGTYDIMASWSGNSEYAGVDSETLTVFVGPQSTEPIQSADSNYIYGQASLGSQAVRPFLGVNNFLSIPLGTNVTITYYFTIMNMGELPFNIQTKTVTIPGPQIAVRLPNRTTQMVKTPDKTVIVPVVPSGFEPVSIPANFNQIINNQFCFVIQNSTAGNYTLNVKGLNNYDMANIQNNTAVELLNATQSVKQNEWYKVIATVMDSAVNTVLQTENGTIIQSNTNPIASKGSNGMVMLVGNNTDSAVVVKDFKIQNQNSPIQPPANNQKIPNKSELFFAYVTVLVLGAITLSAVEIYVKKHPTRGQAQLNPNQTQKSEH